MVPGQHLSVADGADGTAGTSPAGPAWLCILLIQPGVPEPAAGPPRATRARTRPPLEARPGATRRRLADAGGGGADAVGPSAQPGRLSADFIAAMWATHRRLYDLQHFCARAAHRQSVGVTRSFGLIVDDPFPSVEEMAAADAALVNVVRRQLPIRVYGGERWWTLYRTAALVRMTDTVESLLDLMGLARDLDGQTLGAVALRASRHVCMDRDRP